MTTVSAKLQLARELVAASERLARKDKALEIYEYQGNEAPTEYNTRPTTDTASRTQKLGEKVGYLALRFGELFPDCVEITNGLTDAGSWISARAKQETTMSQNNNGYGKGWGKTLDDSRRAMRVAIEAVFADIEKQAFASF